MICKSVINHLKKRGVLTYIWVVNDWRSFEGAFKTGAVGIITDIPTEFKSFLVKKNLYIENN